MLKIILILPHDSRYRFQKGSFNRSLLYPPLTLTTLAALVPPELKAEVRIIDEGVEPLDGSMPADLVGISVLTATASRAYDLADRFRSRGITVVLGGIHVTALPEEGARHADALVVGMGEASWPQLLRDFAQGRLRKRYGPYGPEPLSGLPNPRRDLLKKDGYHTLNTVMASYGCPHQCRFCSVSVVTGGHYYRRPVKDVVAEVRALAGRRIIFLDPSLNGDEDYALALFAALTPLRLSWVGLMTTRVMAQRRLLDAAVRSGCKGILFGFESLSQEALLGEGKAFNSVGNYREIVRRLHDDGVSVLGCFMFGFDTDDATVFDRTLEFVHRSGIDILRYGIYTPFPGTAVFAELKSSGRIIDNDWAHYDHEHVVFRPLRMSPEKLQAGYVRAWRESYGFKAIAARTDWSDPRRWETLVYNLGFRQHALRLPAAVNVSG